MGNVSRLACALGVAAGLAMAAGGEARAQDADRDPAELLKGGREAQRRYNRVLDMDFRMMGKDETRPRKETRIETPDVPAARPSQPLPNWGEPQPGYYPPRSRRLREEDTRKKNWILPPGGDSDTGDEAGGPDLTDPTEVLLQMLEANETARQNVLEALWSGGISTASRNEEEASADRPAWSRYSDDDGNVKEATQNFLLSAEEPAPPEAGLVEGYTPVIADSVFADRGATTETPSGSEAARIDTDNLIQMSADQLMALARQQALTAEAGADAGGKPVGMEAADRLPGIEQFVREQGVSSGDGLRQMHSILAGASGVPEAVRGTPGEESANAATLSQNSWRGSLRTLSGVLNTVPAGQPARTETGIPRPGMSAGAASERSPAMDRAPQPPGLGMERFNTSAFTPAGSSGFGNLSGPVAGPTSVDFSSGFSTPVGGASAGGGLNTRISTLPDVAPPAAPPAVRSGGLDVRNLDILMK